VQDVDNQEDQASPGSSSQDPSVLPDVPMSSQDRQAVLSRAPADLSPVLGAAANNLNNTADAEVTPIADYTTNAYTPLLR